jgi:hypothetical protein
MSRLYSMGLSAPIAAIIFAESGWRGRAVMSRFHQLSGGKTWSAARTASASGVSNIKGFVILGSAGRPARRPTRGPGRTWTGGGDDDHGPPDVTRSASS